MNRIVLRIVAVVCVVAVGAWAFLRTQRSAEVASPAVAAATTADPAKLPQKPEAQPVKAMVKPQATTVYRAAEIPAAVPIAAVPIAAVPIATGPQPSNIVLASATEPLPLQARNARAIDAPPSRVNPIRNELPDTAADGLPRNPLRDLGVRRTSEERPVVASSAPTVLPLASSPAENKSASPFERREASSISRAAAGAQAEAPSASSAQSPRSAVRTDEAPARFPTASSAETEVATRSGAREAPAEASGGIRLEPAVAPAKMPGGAAGARALLAPSDATAPRSAAREAAGAEGAGLPGKKEQEGPQAPQVSVQKFAPEGVQVGKPATFRVVVRNSGGIAAHGVEVRDQIPKGTQLLSTKPRATRGASGELIWELGTLKPGDEVAAEMEIMPVAEGELGSVASVRFNAEASARTTATKPELVVKSAAPAKVLIGEELQLSITVSNPGSGPAHNVVLVERIPAGLQHPAGPELEYQVGTLKPGEQKQLQLTLTAVHAGPITNVLSAHGEGNLRTEDRRELEVIAPRLDVSMEGPRRRFLEREATYVVGIANNGSAPAKQVELVAYLPRGLKFVSANNAGQYDAANQTVRWTLAELPASDADKVELVTLPIEPGEHKLRLEGKAEKGLAVEKEQAVLVEGIAAIKFEVLDTVDPIEKGAESVYEIRVVNQGSKTANNVRVTAMVPPGMRALAAEGPTRNVVEASRVQFESLAQLAPKAETTYRVRVQGLKPGDLRVRVQLMTDEMQEPVTKEESTRVYADE